MRKLFTLIGLIFLLTSCENHEIYQNIEYSHIVKRYRVETVFGQPNFYMRMAYGKCCQLDSIRLAEFVKAYRRQKIELDSIKPISLSSY